MKAVDKIHQFNRFGSRLGLERMTVLLEKLGDPHRELKVIHVAGTNGKGSVCKFLEEGLASCGYKVGLYTSPFIESFNERIRLGGENISDDDLEKYTDPVLKAAEEMVSEGLDSPTEFEVITAVAFLYFREKGSDIVILEVGLGGRGDSTNVVESPLACVITSISYDHMDRLGNTLAQIAMEKAGIIKQGVPVISNVAEREASAVIARQAYREGCRLYDVSKLKYTVSDVTPFGQTVSMQLYGTDYSDMEISMTGEHQCENLKTAAAVIEILRKSSAIKVERSRLYEGFKKAVQPGRFEILEVGGLIDAKPWETSERTDPAVIVDGAHNEAGAKALKETMQRFFSGSRILLVTGMLADKQVDRILDHLTEMTEDIIITEPDNPRRLSSDSLEAALMERGIRPVKTCDAVSGVNAAKDMKDDYDIVLFAGSLYLIGDVRRIVRNEW